MEGPEEIIWTEPKKWEGNNHGKGRKKNPRQREQQEVWDLETRKAEGKKTDEEIDGGQKPSTRRSVGQES